MKDLEFLNSLKALVIDEKRAQKVYRDVMQNRYNMTSTNNSFNSSSDNSGNIQEIAYEEKDDDILI